MAAIWVFGIRCHGEWRQRNAALFSMLRQPLESEPTQANVRVNLGVWGHDDQRQIAGPRLILRDADVDGNPEEFPDGVLYTQNHQLWNADVELEVLQTFDKLRVGLGLNGLAAGMISGTVSTNRSDSGVALG